MALKPKNCLHLVCSRSFRACLLAVVGASLASCASRPVVWHSQGERSQLDSASASVFEGEQVLAARGDAPQPEYAWRDQSLTIRAVESQWKDAMWPERSYRRGHYRRFTLPHNADSVIYYEQNSYSSSTTQYRSYGGQGNMGWYSRGW